MNDLIKLFEELKLEHELPNDNTGEYNIGFVKAMNIAINAVKKQVVNTDIPDGTKCSQPCCPNDAVCISHTEHWYHCERHHEVLDR